MFCTRCGNKIPSKYAVCPYCGYKDEDDELPKQDQVVIEAKVEEKAKHPINKVQKNKRSIIKESDIPYIKLFIIYLLMLIPIAFVVVAFLVFGFTIFFFVSLVASTIIEIFAGYLYVRNKGKKWAQ